LKHPILRSVGPILKPDATRTVLRPFEPGEITSAVAKEKSRAQRIADRILALSDEESERLYARVMFSLESRYRDVNDGFRRRFEEVRKSLIDCHGAQGRRALLIGAYFTEEFSFESAALFNPSVVPHPDQSDAEQGDLRFLLSLRGIGEGHVSSLTFRSGVWKANGEVSVDQPGPYAVGPYVQSNQMANGERVVHLHWSGNRDISETVIFPFLPSQGLGIEDVRLVKFTDDDGVSDYRGTFTSFDGTKIREVLLRTPDFRTIEMRGVEGPWARTKGMALFPRRIGGRYFMLGRQDNENIWLLSSDDPYVWNGGDKLLEPRFPWEFIQLGNCGSPIEIAEGWLVLTHGVGEVRTYCIGACLLDKTDPRKVIARTPRPVLEPEVGNRDGYVPNVVYSCGSMLRDRTLLVPFGVADNFASFGTIKIDDLLSAMS
jgi:predicted GH43/DUF377 family glycosyl hydrolase